MKSRIVLESDYIVDKENYTDLQVLRSPAGHYIGTMYEVRDAKGEVACREAGSRDSEYFATKEAADGYLRVLEAGIEAPLRTWP